MVILLCSNIYTSDTANTPPGHTAGGDNTILAIFHMVIPPTLLVILDLVIILCWRYFTS